jgi:hypothetical protein
MTGIALVSAKGAPGVTTSAVLLAAVWPTPAVLVEADPAGGDLRSWYTDPQGEPLRPELGVVSLLAAHTPTGQISDRTLSGHAQLLPGGLPVLVGPSSPGQVEALRGPWPQLAAAIAANHGDVLVDLGRLTGAGAHDLAWPVLRACGMTLIVCRSTVASVAHARDLHALLAGQGLPVQLLLLGSAAARVDVARAVGLYTEQIHALPADAAAAAGLAGAWNRRLDRSPFVTAGRRVAATLHEQLHVGGGGNTMAPPSPSASGAGMAVTP